MKAHLSAAAAVLVAVVAAFVALHRRQDNRELDWTGQVVPMAQAYSAKLDRSNVTKIINDTPSSNDGGRPLDGTVCVVTGATSGIGKSLTQALVKLGATVVGLGRSSERLHQLQLELGEAVVPIQADLSNLTAVALAANQIVEQFPTIDILVNNAGGHDAFGNLLGTKSSVDGYDLIFAVNYLSHFLLTEKLAPAMSRSAAPVVMQVSSSYHWGVDGSDLVATMAADTTKQPPVASQVGGSHGFILFRSSRSYSNSKLAQIWHARAVKRHQKVLSNHDQARIVSVCPGWVRTGILKGNWFEDLVQHGAFHSDGWGLSSVFLALFDPLPEHEHDFYVNSAMLSPIVPLYQHLPQWAYQAGIRDVLTFAMAVSLLLFQRFFPESTGFASSAESYNVEGADALYQWSLAAVEQFLTV